jgi:hypothetical protein
LTVQQFRKVRIFILAALFVSAYLIISQIASFCAEAASQKPAITETPSRLPTIVANKWKVSPGIRTLKDTEYEALPDGDIGLEYGLNSIMTANYTDGKDNYIVEIFSMHFPSSAYGFFTFLQSKAAKGHYQFWVGKQLIRVRCERNSSPISTEFLRGMTEYFEGPDSILPPLIKHLPEMNKIAKGEVYLVGPKALAKHLHFSFLKDVINFESGTEAITAEYQQIDNPLRLLILEFHTPQLATDGYAKINELKTTLSEPALSQTIVKRIGNYVAVATSVKDVKIAESIFGEIKYTAVVHWEGKTYRSIPLEYRPPDAAALEEASETALVLLRTFYWIGFMLALAAIFGLCAGSGFFYWRRYQRQKAGFEDLFSDAGGTIQLHLVDNSEQEKRKLLSKPKTT